MIFYRRRQHFYRPSNDVVTSWWTRNSLFSSSDTGSRPVSMVWQHRTTQYMRNFPYTSPRVLDGSACADDSTGVSAARATVVSTTPSASASDRAAVAAEGVRVREKICAELDRSKRHAAERRAKLSLGGSGMADSS